MSAKQTAPVTRSTSRVFLLLLVLLCCVGCDACNPWPKCETDEHCRADKSDNPSKQKFYCVNNKCQQCRTAMDCGDPSRQKCEGYRCVQKTCADVVCPSPKRCDPNTLSCGFICNADGENPCDGDPCKVCKSHVCVAKPPVCTKDTDCTDPKKICKNPGTCQAECVPGCSPTKNNCGADEKCENGTCIKVSCTPSKIYFDLDKSYIRGDAKSALRSNLDCFNKRKNMKILIEGHCDERGTRDYNIQLGKRRARSTKKFVQQLGIDAGRLCTVSKGKEEPEVANASTEEDHQKNRRAVFKFVESCP